MSTYIMAPHDIAETVTKLPSPQLSDYFGDAHKISVRNSENGTLYSYVKRGYRVKFAYEFNLSNAKALELKLFIEKYGSVRWRLIDHREVNYIVHLTTNPVEFKHIRNNERQFVRLEFEGTVLS